MMPGNPAVEDYDSPIYDAFWEAASTSGCRSFHILTSSADPLDRPPRPEDGQLPVDHPRLPGHHGHARARRRVRAPPATCKVVCVEADAGWAPHFMYRMDHAYKRHRYWLTAERRPGCRREYFRENIYMTFQDDWVAFQNADQMNWHRLMWANDFPHCDSTWPWSQDVLAEQTAHLTPEQRRAILCDNVAELYGIDTSALPIGGDALIATA